MLSEIDMFHFLSADQASLGTGGTVRYPILPICSWGACSLLPDEWLSVSDSASFLCVGEGLTVRCRGVPGVECLSAFLGLPELDRSHHISPVYQPSTRHSPTLGEVTPTSLLVRGLYSYYIIAIRDVIDRTPTCIYILVYMKVTLSKPVKIEHSIICACLYRPSQYSFCRKAFKLVLETRSKRDRTG